MDKSINFPRRNTPSVVEVWVRLIEKKELEIEYQKQNIYAISKWKTPESEKSEIGVFLIAFLRD